MTKTARVLKWLVWLTGAGLCSVIACAAGVYLYLSPKLPSVESLHDTQLQIPLRIYTSDGLLMGEFGEKRRSPVTYEDVPPDLINAILAAEDDTFLYHHGVDIKGLMRAALQLASTGSIQSGGSTITMQVAKNYFLTRERTFTRKFTEILLALHIERELSKSEIMELYLNKIYLGNRAYGVGAAALAYYGKPIEELDLAQLAMMAGLPQAPSINNPIANPVRAKTRRDWILSRMLRLGSIDQARYKEAVVQPVTAEQQQTLLEVSAPWVSEMARAELYERFGSSAYTEGYQVTTSVHSRLQQAANEAVRKGLDAYDERHGYRKPEAQLPVPAAPGDLPLEQWQEALGDSKTLMGRQAAAVTKVGDQSIEVLRRNGEIITLNWADGLSTIKPYLNENAVAKTPTKASETFKVGDVIRIQAEGDGWKLGQIPDVQAALISLDPNNGSVMAMVGGVDFQESKFNRVLQARRQPGSAFKPFLYAAGLANGFTPASIINDAPVVFDDDRLEETWRPVNASGRFYGPTRLRKALYLSRNLVSIRLLRSVGINNATDYAKRFGFAEEDLPRDLSLALGTLSITPMELVTAYTALANGGYAVKPYLITEVKDADGAVLFVANPPTACPECDEPLASLNGDIENPEADAGPLDPAPPSAAVETVAETEEPLATDEPIAAPRIMDKRVHYLIDSMLKDVVIRGTATRAQALQRRDLAGKTGTTNGPTDAWFAGYNRDVVTVTWFGFDQNQQLGRREYGGSAALPVWIDFMRVALEGKPNHVWEQPDGISMVRIDPVTGLLAHPRQDDAIFEVFRSENTPEEYAHPEQGLGNSSGGSGLIEENLF